ncbi:MAG: O-antigen ligase family protein [Bryobacteraceae bacterium]
MQPKKQQPSVTGPVGAARRPHAAAPGTLASVAVGQAPLSIEDAWEAEPIRKISFYFCLAALFLRLSVLPELIAYVTHVNTYLLYLVAPLAIVSTLLKGGVQRTFQSRASWYWLAFFVWMALARPFSSWPGGSAGRVMSYARVDVIFLVLVGGMALNWNEVRVIFRTIAAAAVVNLVSTRLFEKMAEGRLSLQSSGTIGNPNDLAAQLLLVLPFLLFFMVGRGRSIVVRIAVLGLLLYGIWIILGTASRGGLVGLAVVFLCLLIHASLPQRLLLVVFAGVVALAALAALPAMTLSRLGSLFGATHEEARESAEARKYLFKTSVKYTIEYPVFGVGPGQFDNFEGKTSRAQGFHGNWHATHCAFTEVSSECGVPAFVFFTAGLGSALLLVLRTYRKAKREGYLEIANGCFCYLLAMVGYLVALVFLAQAYTFKLPAMVGLAVTLSYAAMRTMRSGRDGQAPIPPAPVPQRAIHR